MNRPPSEEILARLDAGSLSTELNYLEAAVKLFLEWRGEQRS